MPRKPCLFVPGAIYHVYCRVARGEFVFDDPQEAEEFVDVVRFVRDLDGWSLLAWCLMGNHYHLVTETASVPLWRSMARLQRRVARGYRGILTQRRSTISAHAKTLHAWSWMRSFADSRP